MWPKVKTSIKSDQTITAFFSFESTFVLVWKKSEFFKVRLSILFHVLNMQFLAVLMGKHQENEGWKSVETISLIVIHNFVKFSH